MLTFTKAVGILLTPPGIIVVLAVIGLLLLPRRRRLGSGLLWVSTLALLILSLPVTGFALLRTLENSVVALPSPDVALREGAGAIVVLGAGRYENAPEYGRDTPNALAIERLRYAARLHRLTGLPLLVAGGSAFGERRPEAELMRQVLVEDFGVPVEWVETRSRNTYENAAYGHPMLEAAGVRRVLLVTHAWHMPRAAWAFRQAGIVILPAPLGFHGSSGERSALRYLPSSRGLLFSSRALTEYLGLLWYRIRYRAGAGAAAAHRPIERAISAPG